MERVNLDISTVFILPHEDLIAFQNLFLDVYCLPAIYVNFENAP